MVLVTVLLSSDFFSLVSGSKEMYYELFGRYNIDIRFGGMISYLAELTFVTGKYKSFNDFFVLALLMLLKPEIMNNK